jgi:glycerol kinase
MTQTSVSVGTRIVTLKRLLDAHKPARVGGPREALVTALHGELAQATADTFLLYKKLTEQDRWLSDHPDNMMHRLREDTYLENLEDYQRLCDIIGEARTRLGQTSDEALSWQARTPDACEAWRANWVAVTCGEEAA